MSISKFYFRVKQRRWAHVHKMHSRLLATQKGHILEKYKDKLEQKVHELGLRNTEELLEKFKEKTEALRKEGLDKVNLTSISRTSISKSSFPHTSPALQQRSNSISSLKSGIKTLSAYLDIEKTRALPSKEIETIWCLRNLQNEKSLCAMISLPFYQKMEVIAKKFPTFILPLPRENQDTEVHFLQWIFPVENMVTVMFTHLAEFKLRGEYSQAHTIITHHLELAKDKDIVLLRGEVIEGKGVSVDEAKWLLLCLQKFYGGLGEEYHGTKRRDLVEMFGRGDPNFSVEELVQEAEKIV